MKQRLLSLSLLLFVLLIGQKVFGYDFKINGIAYAIETSPDWDMYSDPKVWVTSGGDYSGSVTIPDRVYYQETEYTLIGIDDKAFKGNKNLTSISFSGFGIGVIKPYAFSDCSNLITVTGNVNYIDEYTFYNCTKLQIAPFPDYDLGPSAFEGCTSLTTLVMPNYCIVNCIPMRAFYGCSSLTSLSIPSSVQSISDEAFAGAGLTSINIPDNVTFIGEHALACGKNEYHECNSLQSVIIGKGVKVNRNVFESSDYYYHDIPEIIIDPANPYCDSRDNCNAIIETSTNTLIFGSTNSIIPNTVTSIGQMAFKGGVNITSIQIPSSVQNIKDDAFSFCHSLASITLPNSVTTIGRKSFAICDLKTIIIGDGLESIGEYAFDSNEELNTIQVSEENHVFDSRNNCNALIETSTNTLILGAGSTIIPDGIVSIGSNAFFYRNNLTSISFPRSLTSIGNYAFSGCNYLTSVTVKNKEPINIGFGVFSNSTNATLNVPYGCKSAYEAADYWKEFKEIIEMLPPTNVALSISDAGIGTYCSEFDLDFTNSDVKAYIVSAFTPSTGKVLLTRIYDVPANTGIVVKGDEGDFQIPTKSAETLVANMLVGVTEDTQLDKVVGDYTNYILAKKAGEVGFYAVADGSTLNANKAYLPLLTASLPASSRVAVVFDDEDAEGNTTYINVAELQNSNIPNVIYNLNGQRLSCLQKGLNIINGKKVIIK